MIENEREMAELRDIKATKEKFKKADYQVRFSLCQQSRRHIC